MKFKCYIYIGIFNCKKCVKIQTVNKDNKLITIPIAVPSSIPVDADYNILTDTSNIQPIRGWWVRIEFDKNIRIE